MACKTGLQEQRRGCLHRLSLLYLILGEERSESLLIINIYKLRNSLKFSNFEYNSNPQINQKMEELAAIFEAIIVVYVIGAILKFVLRFFFPKNGGGWHPDK